MELSAGFAPTFSTLRQFHDNRSARHNTVHGEIQTPSTTARGCGSWCRPRQECGTCLDGGQQSALFADLEPPEPRLNSRRRRILRLQTLNNHHLSTRTTVLSLESLILSSCGKLCTGKQHHKMAKNIEIIQHLCKIISVGFVGDFIAVSAAATTARHLQINHITSNSFRNLGNLLQSRKTPACGRTLQINVLFTNSEFTAFNATSLNQISMQSFIS